MKSIPECPPIRSYRGSYSGYNNSISLTHIRSPCVSFVQRKRFMLSFIILCLIGSPFFFKKRLHEIYYNSQPFLLIKYLLN